MMTLLFEKFTYWVVDYTYTETQAYGKYSGKNSRFFLELYQDEEVVRGLSIEENYTDASKSKTLGGNIFGKIVNEGLTFQKTYLPKFDLNHTILFKAKINFQNGLITGNWNQSSLEISNLPDGIFEMFLDEGEFLKSSVFS